MGVLDHHRAEAEAIIRFSKTGVDRARDQLIDRGAMAICAVEVPPPVPREAKGIDLPCGEQFNAAPVGQKPVDIAGV